MTRSNKAQRFNSSLTRVLMLGLLAICGIATQSKAQEIVKGTFTLSSETRFGGTTLPAGRYTVSIEPVTSMTANGNRVSVFVRPESKSGPVASVFAMASQQSCAAAPSGLTLSLENTGLVARSMCLEKQGLMVDFDLSR